MKKVLGGKLFLNPKSQMVGQIFIYILALVIVALILFFGYNAITIFVDSGESVVKEELKKGLSDMVETISPDDGTVKTRTFNIPKGYDEICFVTNYPDFPEINSDYPIIDDSVRDGSEINTFLIRDNKAEALVDIGKIENVRYEGQVEIGLDILCIKAQNGRMKIKFEGVGDHSLLSRI